MFNHKYVGAAARAHKLGAGEAGVRSSISYKLAVRKMVEGAVASGQIGASTKQVDRRDEPATTSDCRLKELLIQDDETYLHDVPTWSGRKVCGG